MAALSYLKTEPRILVLGAYGLIGSAIVRRLVADGCSVSGLGRSRQTGLRVLPEIEWVFRDLASLCDEDLWQPILRDIDIVVNCAGALQTGPNDNLKIVHTQAIEALAEACKTEHVALVQISAVGALPDASTSFLRSKAGGDAAVREAGIDYWILRPGIVIAQTAYGGSALLRALAAFPVVQPIANGGALIQTVGIRDVAQAVSLAVKGDVPVGLECDLVEEIPHNLRDVILMHRNWLGRAPARYVLNVPRWMMSAVTCLADILGVLGWRSPLRSTAVSILNDGVLGDPKSWNDITGHHLPPLRETLSRMPAMVEDRQFARMSLLMPLIFVTLFVFWFISGLFGLINIKQASGVLVDVGWSHGFAKTSVVFWAFVDIAIAIGLLVRKFAAWSCWAMIVVSIIYLVSATLIVPALWADPLGPLVKVIPSIALALVAQALLEMR